MNKKYVEKKKLTESIKRLMDINNYDVKKGNNPLLEYTFNTTAELVNEEGDDDENDDTNLGNDNGDKPDIGFTGGDSDNDSSNDDLGGGDDNGDLGGDNNLGGDDLGNDGPNDDFGGDDSNDLGDEESDDSDDFGNDDFGGDDLDSEGDDDSVETEESSDDDEVIDVDDLTNSQEASEFKIDDVDEKLTTLLQMLNNFNAAINVNNKKIDDLNAEISSRVPNDKEKINIRTMASQPYNVNPEDYWEKQKSLNPNYDVYSDNEVSPQKEQEKYIIRKSDIENPNTNAIDKTFENYPKDFVDYFE